jgi:hypothetical protein
MMDFQDLSKRVSIERISTCPSSPAPESVGGLDDYEYRFSCNAALPLPLNVEEPISDFLLIGATTISSRILNIALLNHPTINRDVAHARVHFRRKQRKRQPSLIELSSHDFTSTS